MARFFLSVFIAFLTPPLSGFGEETKAMAPYTRKSLIAHRGASAYAPEHTLPAYSLALRQGADFIEPDLQITRDGVLVCLHDATLERTTNVAVKFPTRFKEVRGKKTWPVADFTLAEIKSLDAGIWKGQGFAGTRVPTFQEMVDLVKGQAGIIPETKSPDTYAKLGFDMGKLLMEALKKNGLENPGADPKTPVIIQSFSLESLRKLREEQACKLPLVFLFTKSTGLDSREGLKKLKPIADGIAPHKDLVLAKPELVRLAHGLGMSVTVWTCREGQTKRFKDVQSEMAHLLQEVGVDAIFTDNPDKFPRP